VSEFTGGGICLIDEAGLLFGFRSIVGWYALPLAMITAYFHYFMKHHILAFGCFLFGEPFSNPKTATTKQEQPDILPSSKQSGTLDMDGGVSVRPRVW